MEIECEQETVAATVSNPAELPPHELADYIVDTHHAFLRREFPRLHELAERVANVHGEKSPSLVQVFRIYCGLEDELSRHMMKEEQTLFPAVSAMSRGESEPVALAGPIACMLQEHDDAGAALARLHELTVGYQPPENACNTCRALFSGLSDLETDLHLHIHLENSVLFPAAQKLAGMAA